MSQQPPGACVGTLLKYALSWQLHTCCVSGQHTQARASRSENKTVCEMEEKADTCMEMMSALQALTLPSQGELKSLNPTVREGSVPSDSSTHPAFCRPPQQPPMNPVSLSHASWDTLAGGQQRCCQTGGAELGVPPRALWDRPPARALPPRLPRLLSARSGAPGRGSSENEQITPRQTASVCSLPGAASALCQTFLRVWQPALWPFPLGLLPNPEAGVSAGA